MSTKAETTAIAFNLKRAYQDAGQELTRTLTTEQGLTLTLRYVAETEFDKAQRRLAEIKNPKSREINSRRALLDLVAGGVVGWDMTPEIMANYLAVDPAKLPASIPCEPGVVRDLVELSDTFFSQVNAGMRDLIAFRESARGEEQKN